jgi:PAS domain S-box-containing protein
VQPARGPSTETIGTGGLVAPDANDHLWGLFQKTHPYERLLHAILAISRCATLEEALQPLLDAALDITQMDGGVAYWVQDDVAVVRHHRGLPEAFLREVMCMSLTLPPVQAVLRQQELVEVAEISSAMRELLGKHGIWHAFSFPLRARETVFGFLNVGSTRAEGPPRTDLQALQILVREMESLFCRLHDEKALRESEERYRTLWKSALDGIVLHELLFSPQRGGFIDVNECTCRMLGYSREELLRLSPFDLVDDETKAALPELAAKLGQLGSMLFEVTLVAKDGRRIAVEVNASTVQFAGHRVGLSVLRDVTERKRAVAALQESEACFRAFMNNSPTIAWMKDEQGRHVYLSETYENRFGLRLEDCQGKTDFDLWPREIAEEFQRNDQEVLRTGRTVEVVEETPAPEGGRCYWWSFKFPFEDACGRKFVGGIGVDITERRRLEDDLRRLNDRLEEQVQARTEELRDTIDRLQTAMKELAHRADQLRRLTLELTQAEDRERKRLAEFLHDDLQQTLAAVKFQLNLLGSQVQGDAGAATTVRHARQMIKEAIEKSRDLSHELGPAVLFHGDVAEAFGWLADQMGSRHGLAVRVDLRGPVDSLSEAMRSFLYRTAQEFLFNVVKHAQVREARLRLQRVDEKVWLIVRDKGRGFDVASLAQTAGYGLMNTRERVELLGGRMRVKSTLGRGSTFSVTVPAAGA